MSSDDLLEIDLASEPAGALLRAVRELHGGALVAAARRLDRLFLLRSPWAPGLCFVGAEVGVTDCAGHAAKISVGGSGEQLDVAFAACIGEAVERLCVRERPGDLAETAPERVRSMALVSGEPVLVPADWCFRPPSRPGLPVATGTASGPTFEAATVGAVLELVERHAAALWWVEGAPGRPLPGGALKEVTALLGRLRAGTAHRSTWFLDISSELDIPVAAALSTEADGRGLAIGLAAGPSIAAAARSALRELCQSELGLLIARVKHDRMGGVGLTEADLRHLARAEAIAGDCRKLLGPVGEARRNEALEGCSGSPLSVLRRSFARCGIEASVVDLTRPDFGIAVARAVAPQLRPLAATATAGGRKETREIPLF